MNYTTIEQSKKLVELGLNPDTADMVIVKDNTYCNALSAFNGATLCQNYSEIKNKTNYIPCWSLGALWDINNICGIGPNNFGNKDVSSEHLFNTLYRWICIELIEDSDGLNSFLIEEGYLKKEAKDE